MYIYDYWENKDFFDVYDYGNANPLDQNLKYPIGWNTSNDAFASLEKDSPPWHTVSVRQRHKPDPRADLWNGYCPKSNDRQSMQQKYTLQDLNVRFCDGDPNTAVQDILDDPKQYTWEGVSDPESLGDDNYNVWMSNIPVAWPITDTEIVVRLSSLMQFKSYDQKVNGNQFFDTRIKDENGNSRSAWRKYVFMNEIGNIFEVEVDIPTFELSGFEGDIISGFNIDGPLGSSNKSVPDNLTIATIETNWGDYFLGLGEYEGQKRVFGDMVVLSLKPGSPTFSQMGIPIVSKIGDLFTLPKEKLFPAYTLDCQGRVVIQYVSYMPENNKILGDSPYEAPTWYINTNYWPIREEFTGEVLEDRIVASNSLMEYDLDCSPFYYGLSKYIAPMRCKVKTTGDESNNPYLGDIGSPSWIKTEDHGWVFIGTWKGGMHNAYVKDPEFTSPLTEGNYGIYLTKNETPFDEINATWGSNLHYVDLSTAIDYYVDNRLKGENQLVVNNPYENISCSVEKLYGEDTSAVDALTVGGASIVGVCCDVNFWYDSKELDGTDLEFAGADVDKRLSMGILSVGKGYNITPYGDFLRTLNDNGSGLGEFQTKEVEVIAPYSDFIRGTAYGESSPQNRDIYDNSSFIHWKTNLAFSLKHFTRETVVPIPPHKRIVRVGFSRQGEPRRFVYPMFNLKPGDEYLVPTLNGKGSDLSSGVDPVPFIVQTVSWTTVDSENNKLRRSDSAGGLPESRISPTGQNAFRISNLRENNIDTNLYPWGGCSIEEQAISGPKGFGGNYSSDLKPYDEELSHGVNYTGIDADTVKNPFLLNRVLVCSIERNFIDSFSVNASNPFADLDERINITRNSEVFWNTPGANELWDTEVPSDKPIGIHHSRVVSRETVTEDPVNVIFNTSLAIGRPKMSNVWSTLDSNLYSLPIVMSMGNLDNITRWGEDEPLKNIEILNISENVLDRDIAVGIYSFEDAALFTSVPWYFPYIKNTESDPPTAEVYNDVFLNGNGPLGLPGDSLELIVETVSKDSAYRKRYKIADYAEYAQPSGSNYELIFTNSANTILATYDSRNPATVNINSNDLSDNVLRVTLSPIDGEESQWIPSLKFQRSYQNSNEFDLTTTVFKPIIIDGYVQFSDNGEIGRNTLSYTPITLLDTSDPIANRVDIDLSKFGLDQGFSFKFSCNYPHDNVGLGDTISVQLSLG